MGRNTKIDLNEFHVSMFNDLLRPNNSITVTAAFVMLAIKSGTYKDKIEAIRRAETKEERKPLKEKLPGVTMSGGFSKRRKDGLVSYSKIIWID